MMWGLYQLKCKPNSSIYSGTGRMTTGTRGPAVSYTWTRCVYYLASMCPHSNVRSKKLQNLEINNKLKSSPTFSKCLALFLINVVTKVNSHRSCWWNHYYILLSCCRVFFSWALSLSFNQWSWGLKTGQGIIIFSWRAVLRLLIIHSWFIQSTLPQEKMCSIVSIVLWGSWTLKASLTLVIIIIVPYFLWWSWTTTWSF